MVKLLLTAPHTPTYPNELLLNRLIYFLFSLSQVIVNCAVLLAEKNGEEQILRGRGWEEPCFADGTVWHLQLLIIQKQ